MSQDNDHPGIFLIGQNSTLFYFFDAFKYKILMVDVREQSIKVDPPKPKQSVNERQKNKNFF